MTIQELFNLSGKVAVVTGGARNLGYDMALALAEAGADVVITSRTIANAQAAAVSLHNATGRRIEAAELNVSDELQVVRLVDHCLERFGKIDIFVNNAGNVVSTPENAPFHKRSIELWNDVIATNLTGVFLCCKHAAEKAMIPSKSGVLINIGSTAGMVGKDRRVYLGTSMGGVTLDYHAAKAGVINITRDLAVYLAPHGIRANCISPGGFFRNQPEAFVKRYSEGVPMGRMGEDGKEIKGAVVFLASEASSYVTGHNLIIDGGLTAW